MKKNLSKQELKIIFQHVNQIYQQAKPYFLQKKSPLRLYSLMLSLYADIADEKAMNYWYEKIKKNAYIPYINTYIYSILIYGYGKSKNIEKMDEIYQQAVHNQHIKVTKPLLTSYIVALGSLKNADLPSRLRSLHLTTKQYKQYNYILCIALVKNIHQSFKNFQTLQMIYKQYIKGYTYISAGFIDKMIHYLIDPPKQGTKELQVEIFNFLINELLMDYIQYDYHFNLINKKPPKNYLIIYVTKK